MKNIPTENEIREGYAENPKYDTEEWAARYRKFDSFIQADRAKAWVAAIEHVETLLGAETKRAAMKDNPYNYQ